MCSDLLFAWSTGQCEACFKSGKHDFEHDCKLRQEGILVVTWGSVAQRGSTLDTRLLFSMIKVRQTVKDVTLEQFYEVLKWSLECLADGHHPYKDHLGVPFSNDYDRSLIIVITIHTYIHNFT